MPSLSEVVVWVVVGAIAGTLAGRLVTGERQGFGLWRNLGLGLLGAVIGGVIFHVFGLLMVLEPIAISLRDVISALTGSLAVLAGLWLWKRFRNEA